MSSHESLGVLEESKLVASVINGNAQSFGELVNKYQGLVVSIVFKMVQQQEDREDLCQEVFLKVYDKLGSFRFQSKLSTWIASIAFNACINFIKKKKSVLLDDLYERNEESDVEQDLQITDTSITPDQLLLKKETSLLLQAAIGKLSPIQRTILQLFHNDELSLEEISAITMLPVNTIKSHLFRARNNLKNQLVKQLKG